MKPLRGAILEAMGEKPRLNPRSPALISAGRLEAMKWATTTEVKLEVLESQQ